MAEPEPAKKATESLLLKTHLASLGNSAKSIRSGFCCSGSLPVPDGGVSIWFDNADGTQSVLRLPNAAGQDLEELVAACSPASFGRGTETVYDPSVRNARALPPSHFATNLDLGRSWIARDIKDFITSCCGDEEVYIPSDYSEIRAELYKLNIYGPGGFFKPHVDTPRDKYMFGSLVVALPCEYTGGELIVRHRDTSTSFALSGGQGIRWAAFFSDCEHEIAEVTSGFRLTLTYNLHKLPPDRELLDDSSQLPMVEPSSSQISRSLGDARDCPEFFPDGCVLGFSCQHLYVDEIGDSGAKDERMLQGSQLWMLKGADAVLFAAARAAGLEAKFVPIYLVGKNDHFIGHKIGEITPYMSDWKSDPDLHTDKHVVWCSEDFHWTVGQDQEMYYGNHSSDKTWYGSAAILVTMPPWNERRSLSTQGESSSLHTKRFRC